MSWGLGLVHLEGFVLPPSPGGSSHRVIEGADDPGGSFWSSRREGLVTVSVKDMCEYECVPVSYLATQVTRSPRKKMSCMLMNCRGGGGVAEDLF